MTDNQQKIVVLGAGFAGLRTVLRLSTNKNFHITLIDKMNYHQFQPLLYQVATAGLEPSAISFPLRKALQMRHNIHVRWAEVLGVDTEHKQVQTSVGNFEYDTLVIALGADTNYFGNKQLEHTSLGMKSVPEALLLRNELLSNYERATSTQDDNLRQALLNVVIVGGGATGVELAGAIAEMKNNILQKDYPELDFGQMRIYLLQAIDRLLPNLSPYASRKVKKYLESLGVIVELGVAVQAYDGTILSTSTALTINSKCVVWAAGVRANALKGLPPSVIGPGGRIKVDRYNAVMPNVYALGDIAIMQEEHYPNGHPQVAPAALQQAGNMASNLLRQAKGKQPRPFTYKDKGSMATVGRNLAIVEVGKLRFGGFLAWVVWMFVHLVSIIGVRNRFFVFTNWIWNYFTYDVSLRLIIRPANRKTDPTPPQDGHTDSAS